MWARLINVALGIWLMAAPAVLGYSGAAANNDRIAGPIIAAFAFVAIWEILRDLRRINMIAGPWLVLAPLVMSYPTAAAVNSVCVGILVTCFAFIRGSVPSRFGGGWIALLRKDPYTTQEVSRSDK